MRITLNSKQYEVDNLIEKQVSPFITRIAQGGLEWENKATCDIEEYRDLRGGLGLESEEKPSGRFYFSTGVETTKEGYITLGALVNTAGTLGVAPLHFADFNLSGTMRTFAFGTSVCKYWDGTAWQASDSSAFSAPTDVMVATDTTDNYLIVCDGTGVRYTEGASWASLSTENVKYMCMFDNRLIGVDAAYNKIWYSPRNDVDGTLASFVISGDWSVVTDIFSGKLLTTGEPCIYMLTDTGLWAIDFYTQTCWKMEVRYPYTANARVGMYWNSHVYAATGAGISRITPSGITQWGLDVDDGLPTTYQGYVYDMIGTSHWVIIAVAGGTNDSIFKRHESTGGWHQVYSSSSAIEKIHYSPASMFTNGRLWFGDGAAVKYIQFPDTTHDVTKVSGYTYAASGDLYLTRLSRVSSMPKVAVSFDGLTDELSDNEKVTSFYIIDDKHSFTDSEWDELGQWLTYPNPSLSFGKGLGKAFHDICFKLHLERGDTTTNTPVIKSIGFKYAAFPETVSAWTFEVKGMGDRAKEIISNLEAVRDASTLVNFSPDGDTLISETFVRVVSMPSKRELEGKSKEQTFAITVAEVK